MCQNCPQPNKTTATAAEASAYLHTVWQAIKTAGSTPGGTVGSRAATAMREVSSVCTELDAGDTSGTQNYDTMVWASELLDSIYTYYLTAPDSWTGPLPRRTTRGQERP